MTVLGIDTSGKTASCAVLRDGILLGQRSVYTSLTHSQVILPFVERLLDDVGLRLGDIDIIAVADGPGSYTGLRIGISVVKGLCYDGKPCLGVSTLAALAYNCVAAKARIIPVMSARPGIVYFGAYDSDGESISCAADDRVAPVGELEAVADGYQGDIILTGDAAQTVKDTLFLDNPSVRIAPVSQRLQQASGVCEAALRHLDMAGGAASLNARYLQVTKAEKDLFEKNSHSNS